MINCLRATGYLITSHVTSQPVLFLSPPLPAIAIPRSQGITAAQASSSLFSYYLGYQFYFAWSHSSAFCSSGITAIATSSSWGQTRIIYAT